MTRGQGGAFVVKACAYRFDQPRVAVFCAEDTITPRREKARRDTLSIKSGSSLLVAGTTLQKLSPQA